MKAVKPLVLIPLLLLPALLFAHTELTESAPADGAVLNQAPSALELGFTEEVQLLKVELVDANGAPLATGFMPAAESSKTFSVGLPALLPASYTASWVVLGADGHRVEGSVQFAIDPAAEESAGTAAPAEHHGH